MTVDIRVGKKTYVAEYLEGRSASGVQLFLIRCDEFFDRPGIYGEHGKPYEDNAARFILFCKAALELARRLTPSLQILHRSRLGGSAGAGLCARDTICHSQRC